MTLIASLFAGLFLWWATLRLCGFWAWASMPEFNEWLRKNKEASDLALAVEESMRELGYCFEVARVASREIFNRLITTDQRRTR